MRINDPRTLIEKWGERIAHEIEQKKQWEEEKYEAKRCPECGKKRCPPEMNICPFCHPNTDYE